MRTWLVYTNAIMTGIHNPNMTGIHNPNMTGIHNAITGYICTAIRDSYWR